ncbi:hypothetical protein PV328_011830 [Microctonus aethiopoides]|uniref:Uncharacterized protein n=1 Tax=Microctonus aethiopoides TaxID=144406 RepID=A0AA39FHP0_9HYME|nr:hypothetical protein PV328_011830 [Microctonus aethiopoides]
MRRSQNPSVCRMEKTKLADVRTCNVPNENIDINPNSLDIIQPLEPRFRGTVTQVNFYEKKVNSTLINMFSIIREKGVTCEAGTQSNISIEKSEKKKIIISKNTADKGCGPTIQQTDKQVGPNSLDEND